MPNGFGFDDRWLWRAPRLGPRRGEQVRLLTGYSVSKIDVQPIIPGGHRMPTQAQAFVDSLLCVLTLPPASNLRCLNGEWIGDLTHGTSGKRAAALPP